LSGGLRYQSGLMREPCPEGIDLAVEHLPLLAGGHPGATHEIALVAQIAQ